MRRERGVLRLAWTLDAQAGTAMVRSEAGLDEFVG